MNGSHYPSSAELAAFRRSTDESNGRHFAPEEWDTNTGGAWPHERAKGIGAIRVNARWYYGGQLGYVEPSHVATYARREANRMRSAAVR